MLKFKAMKKTVLFICGIVLTGIISSLLIISCKKEKSVPTEMTINITSTPKLNIGDVVNAKVTIVTDGVKSFKYYKIVDNKKDAGTEASAQLVQTGKTWVYDFSYTVQQYDDLYTLGFEFELTDDKGEVKNVGLVVNINISVESMLVKYDWKVTESTWLGIDVLQPWDAAVIYRFNKDGSYQEDLSPEHAADNHHFCFWVFKETPNNGDTISILRLVRRLKQGEDMAIDEYYDYKITAANESEMTMFWDVAVFGLLGIQNTFKSQAKGAFVPYGTPAEEAKVNANASLSCSHIDPALLIIN